MEVRRVVTGHNEKGKPVFVSDERVPGGILAAALCTTTLMMMSTDSNVSRVRGLLEPSVLL
jgi:hypothetical protein